MKKTILLIGLLLAGTMYSHAQIAYYDALKLRAYVSSNTFEMNNDSTTNAIGAILLKYFPDSAKVNKAKLKDMLKGTSNKNYNPFLAKYFGAQTASGTNLVAAAANIVGNANVGNVVSGWSSFLIKRAKQEALIAIIERLRDSTKFPEFTVLFPRTLSILNNFDSWQYSNALNTVEQAFDKDLQQLLGDLPKLAKLQLDKKLTYSAAVKNRIEAMKKFLADPGGRALTSAMLIGNGFLTGQKVPDVIHTIADTSYLGKVPGFPDAGQSVQLLDIVSFSVRSNVPKQNYITSAQFMALLADSISRDLYLGLVYLQIKQRHIVIGNQQIASLVVADASGTISYIQDVIARADSLQASVNKWQTAKKKWEKDLTTYWPAIFADGNDFFNALGAINKIDTRLQLPPTVQNVMAAVDTTLSVAQAISERNYNAAIVDLNALFPSRNLSDFRAFLVKYGSFAANLVTAKNADDAENAIEAMALPVGSYSIKQHSEWNIALNGYLGYGWDFNAGVSHGIYAPIGFSFSHAVSSTGKAGALTAFISLIDLGSMVSYQLNNDSLASKKQDIRLESIVSPSIQLFYSIPGFPISLGTGVRRTPKLFYSTNTGFTAVQPRSVFNISVLFDIPILTIYNKAYK